MKRFSLVLILITLLVSGCAAEPNVLTLCSSLPLDNGNNSRAVSMSRAIQMAIDEQGTVTFAGQAYELRHVAMDDTSPDPADSGWDTAQEERNARAAIAEHDCIAYIGTYNSGAAKIAMPILNRAQMLMISPGNTYPGLTKPGGGIGDEPWIYSPLGSANRNYCRVIPSDDLQAPAAARYAAEVLGVQSVYIFHDTETYGRGLAEIFADSARQLGIEVVNGAPLGVGVGEGRNRWTQIANEIIAVEPQLVYFGGTTNEAVTTILRQLRDNEYDGYFMGADGIAEAAFITGASAFSDERVFATLVGLPPSELNDLGQAFVSDYSAMHGDPDAFAAPSYEAAQVVIRGLESVPAQDGLTPERADFIQNARRALLATVKQTREYQGILGTWSFDENCDTTMTTISINQVDGSEFEFVGVIE